MDSKEHSTSSSSSSSSSLSSVQLFEQEEQEVLEIPLSVFVQNASSNNNNNDVISNSSNSTTPVVLRLRQYTSHDDRWGIHSSVWDGGIALLYYVLTHWKLPVVRRRMMPLVVVPRPSEPHHDPSSIHGDADINNNHCNNDASSSSSSYIIDLGAGTGIVGIGIATAVAAMAMQQREPRSSHVNNNHDFLRVSVTDLHEVLPLLHHNVQMNTYNNNALHYRVESEDLPPAPQTELLLPTVMVHELAWGCDATKSYSHWLRDFVGAPPERDTSSSSSTPTTATNSRSGYQPHQHHHHRHILITGADIIYRPSLFVPLWTTVADLYNELQQQKLPSHCENDTIDDDDDAVTAIIPTTTTIDIWFSCQSIRSYAQDFWSMADQYGFVVQRIATVQLNDRDKTDLSGISVFDEEVDVPTTDQHSINPTKTHSSPSSSLGPSAEQQQQQQQHHDNRRKDHHGINWIYSLTKIE